MTAAPGPALAEAALSEAMAIGDRLAAGAATYRDRATWVAPRYAARGTAPGAPALEALGPTLGGGTAGVALFLARLAAAGGDPGHARVAAAAARHAQRHAGAIPARYRFGAFQGVVGVAWATAEVGRRLGQPALLRRAERLLAGLPGPSAAAHESDLVFGAAGGIPLLLDLERHGAPGAGSLARRLGPGLVRRAGVDGAAWSWGPPRGAGGVPPLTGLSHGAAGIGWALAELHAATGEERFRAAALGAVEYERRWFDPARANWANPSEPADPNGRFPCWSTWCHGAPGIGVARSLMARLLRAPALAREARLARSTAAAGLEAATERPGAAYHLCCGLAGQAECLDLMDAVLGDPGSGGASAASPAARLAADIARYGAAARRAWGPFTDWPTGPTTGAQVGLMQGLAGIGHHLLRAARPAVAPSVLVPGAAPRSWADA